MIGGFDEDEFPGLWQTVHHLFKLMSRSKLVARSRDEEFRFRARLQKCEVIVAVIDRRHGCTEADQSLYALIGASGAKTDGGPERESRKHDGQRVLTLEPIQGGADILYFSAAMIVFTLAQAGSPKIEAQHGKPKAVERLHGVKDNFVVESSAEQGVRMANQCGMRGVGGPGVEQGFEASSRADEKK